MARPAPSPPGTRPDSDYVYLWVDGIHLKVRLDQEKLCLLVMFRDGRKELVAITDGYRESTESWLICCATANAVG